MLPVFASSTAQFDSFGREDRRPEDGLCVAQRERWDLRLPLGSSIHRADRCWGWNPLKIAAKPREIEDFPTGLESLDFLRSGRVHFGVLANQRGLS